MKLNIHLNLETQDEDIKDSWNLVMLIMEFGIALLSLLLALLNNKI
jgi:hypothetical protein